MIISVKNEVYDNINEIKTDIGHHRRKYDDGVFEKASRAEISSEKAMESA